MMKKSLYLSRKLWVCLASIWLVAFSLSAQQKSGITIKGTVVDNTSFPLPGVNVTIQGAKQGVVTDVNGNFSIMVPSESSVLQFTYIGFDPYKQMVGKERNLKVSLKETAQALDEVVVIGYGSASKESVSSAVVKVNTGNVIEKGFSNLQQMLTGAASGVTVSTVSGQPGAAMNIEIRGVNSISGSTQPLYVIDGVPMDDENAMLNLNPNDIESMNVLKDASSAAIYGSRGNNGVILITTKQGREGKTKVDASYSHRFAEFYRFIPMLNGPDYARYQNELRVFRGYVAAYEPSSIESLPTFDHTKSIMQLGQTMDANVSLSGGDKKTKFYVSGQYLKQEGVIVNTDLERFNIKANFDRELVNKLNLSVQVNYSNSVQNGNVTSGLTGSVSTALRWAPTSPLTLPNGNYNVLPGYMYGTDAVYMHPLYGELWVGRAGDGKIWTEAQVNSTLNDAGSVLNNPVAVLREQVMRTTRDNFMTNLTLKYNISKEWNVLGRFAYTLNNTWEDRYQPISVRSSTQWVGSATQTNARNTKALYELTGNWDKSIQKHKINVIASASAENFVDRNNSTTVRGFVQDQTQMYDMSSGSILMKPSSGYNGYQLASLVARAIYSYNWKYYLTVSGRLDGSSRFAPGKRWGVFPTMSASWNINKEEFMKAAKWINLLKLRAGFGITGGQAVSSYSTLPLMSSVNSAFGNEINVGYARSVLENPSLTWERNNQANVGLDFTVLDNRLSLNIDAYYKLTDNLLMRVPIPSSTGFVEMWSNVGSIENKGVEFNLNVTPIRTKDFSWNVNANVSFNQNIVKSLNLSDEGYVSVGSADGSGASISRLVTGQSVSQFYGLELLGIYTPSRLAEKPTTFNPSAVVGNNWYNDRNNDKFLDLNDRTVIGRALPLCSGGFGTSLKYKDFDLQANFVYSYGNQVYNAVRMELAWQYAPAYQQRYQQVTPIVGSNGNPLANQPVMSDEERLKILQNNDKTKLRMLGVTENNWFNDYGVEDASFLRCREIYLGYSMPAKLIRAIRLNSLKLYASVSNPFIITNYTGYNPEVGSGTGVARGYDTGSYPLARTYALGLMISF